MRSKSPRRVGMKRDVGHPANLYFRLIEKGRALRNKIKNPHQKYKIVGQ